MSRSRVDTLSELCFPFLKGGNSAFIAAIASGFFLEKTNIGHSNGPNRKLIKLVDTLALCLLSSCLVARSSITTV